MNEKTDILDNYTRLARYCMLFSILGAVSYLLMFPSGIYYAFFCGIVGASGGFLTRPYSRQKGNATTAILLGVIDVAFALIAFHGLNSLYTMLQDPVAGPQVSSFVLHMLEQYGATPETFVTIMHQ